MDINSQFKFQFHKGTIRTVFVPPVYEQVQQFQFHKGTIRTSSEV